MQSLTSFLPVVTLVCKSYTVSSAMSVSPSKLPFDPDRVPREQAASTVSPPRQQTVRRANACLVAPLWGPRVAARGCFCGPSFRVGDLCCHASVLLLGFGVLP